MYKQKILWRAALIIVFGLLVCSIRGQTAYHPTIDSVSVTYVATTQDTLKHIKGVKVMPQATISLKEGMSVSRIYFKILDAISHSTVYEVTYDLSNPAIIDGDGNTLFQSIDDTVLISTGLPILLKPYTYEIRTEDSLHNLSVVFSTLQ